MRIAVETDGRESHTTLRAFENDRARDRALTLLGWTVIRFTWRDIDERPEEVERQLRLLLGWAVRRPRLGLCEASGVIERGILAPALLAVGVAALLGAGAANAATFEVTSLANNGPGTLREAINRANDEATNPGADTIQISATGVISLTTALPSISAPLSINGPGAKLLTIRRAPGAATKFGILGQQIGAALEVRDVTLTGSWIDAVGDAFGGAITSKAPLLIERTVLTGNVLTAGNLAYGGVIYADDGVTLRDSVISDNVAVGGGSSQGVALYSPAGPVTLERTVITGNFGGGANARVVTVSGALHIVNSTFSENSNGIAAFGPNPTVTSSTLVDNEGPALIAVNPLSDFTLTNSIIAGSGNSCLVQTGSFSSGGHNIADDVSCNLTGIGDRPNTDPQLLPLADNGGFGPTHLPASTSPAIDAGSAAGLTTDGRGLPRPYDDPAFLNAPGGDGSDIGAVEVQPPPAQPQPPQVSASAKRKQKLAKPVKVKASCAAACSLAAKGALKGGGVKGKSMSARAVDAAAGQKVVLKLTPSAKVARKLKALKRKGKKARVTINVTATDAGGTASAAPLKVTLR